MQKREKEGKRGKGGKALPSFPFSFSFFFFITLLFAFAVSCKRGTEHKLQQALDAWDSGDYKLAAEEYEQY